MTNLNEIFENLKNNGRFTISTNAFTEFFDSSIVKLVRFFSDHWFNITNDGVETFDLEKQISPSHIYSIINGAKPLIIECEEELPDGEFRPYAYEVWLFI